jgi:hypothetical protein
MQSRLRNVKQGQHQLTGNSNVEKNQDGRIKEWEMKSRLKNAKKEQHQSTQHNSNATNVKQKQQHPIRNKRTWKVPLNISNCR